MASTDPDHLCDEQEDLPEGWGGGVGVIHSSCAAGPDNAVVFAALMVNLLTTPFNLNLSQLNGSTGPLGCVASALALILQLSAEICHLTVITNSPSWD